MASPTTWRRSLVGSHAEAAAASAWLETVGNEAGIAAETLFSMQVCLEELLTNVIKYAGSDRPQIEVVVARRDGGYALTVENDGTPFDITSVESRAIDAPLSEIEPGGLGLLLVKKLSDGVTFTRAGLGSRITAEFRAPEALAEVSSAP